MFYQICVLISITRCDDYNVNNFNRSYRQVIVLFDQSQLLSLLLRADTPVNHGERIQAHNVVLLTS